MLTLIEKFYNVRTLYFGGTTLSLIILIFFSGSSSAISSYGAFFLICFTPFLLALNKGRLFYYSFFAIIFIQSIYGIPYWLSFTGYNFAKIFSLFDEFIIISGLVIYSIMILMQRRVAILEIDKYLLLLTVFFIFSGLLSNYFSYTRISLGTFDIVKNLSLILVFRFATIDDTELNMAIGFFIRIMFFATIIAIVQEILTISGIHQVLTDYKGWLYAATSFIGHTVFGLLSCLLFSILFFKPSKTSFEQKAFILSIIGIIISGSRMSYIFFALFLLIHLIKSHKLDKKVFQFLIFIFLILAMGFWKHFYYEIMLFIKSPVSLLRTHGFERGIAIFMDNPILGMGPGTYGGMVSFLTNSPSYAIYNFSSHWFSYCKGFRSIDNFFPQLIAEGGIIGTAIFFIFWFKVSHFLFSQKHDFSWLGNALGMSLLCILPILFGSGLNLQIITFMLWSLIGMFIAYSCRHSFIKTSPDYQRK